MRPIWLTSVSLRLQRRLDAGPGCRCCMVAASICLHNVLYRFTHFTAVRARLLCWDQPGYDAPLEHSRTRAGSTCLLGERAGGTAGTQAGGALSMLTVARASCSDARAAA